MEDHFKRTPSKNNTCQSSPEDWFKRRQRSVDNQYDVAPRMHGFNSSFHTNKSADLKTRSGLKDGSNKQTGKMLKDNRAEPSPQDKRISRRSDRGYKGSKPSLNPADRAKLGITCSTFEMKLADFPELGDITPGNHTAASLHQEPTVCASAVMPAERQSSPVLICKNVPKRRTKSAQQVPSSGKCDISVAITADQDSAVSNPTGSSAQSWANIASQPPRVIQKSPKANTSSQEDLSAQPEQKTEKKRRKKKKKSKTASENTEELEEHLIQQEPPKFEDEEEFPDLSLAFELKGHSVAQKEGLSLHPEIKHKATSPTSASIDTKKTQTSQKKSKVPVQLDLGNMLAVLERKQQSQKSKQDQRPVTLSVGGALPVVHKETSVQKKPWQQEKTPHNPLDSTCPLVKKGKQREVPKAKKPTPLKRVILREREERKQNRLLEERDPVRVATEAAEKETSNSENPSDTSLPDNDQHLHTNIDENPELVGTEESECDQPGSPSDHKLDDGVSQNATLKSWNPSSNPNLPKIHSRKFRDYCNQVLSKDVDECVSSLLKELVRFQDRLYQKDPMKARMKRRLVMGLREVLKHLKLRKVKCVIISPNCERIQSKGGLDEALHTIIDTCRDQGIPFVFALSRKALGRCVNKAVPVSLVGIFNYDGAQDHYHKMIELSAEARKAYEVMIENLEAESQEQQEDLQEELQEVEPSGKPSGTEEPEYIKIWKKMLEKDYNHPFLDFEDQFSSISIGSEQLLDDHEGS
ncbi:selenocysteine insertion sequence-binding protein 2-like [Megalobrama amblycephala]|uniref:selenocysteine insertion sequence-binding protein 2-like n=1 Tax=Megalobrama amblycephala TaxID=75352 RepID=UPI002013D98F|nr:selenocysteine insertion sequence-binding protein 2-like [Megalobrama amblycephala]XP_048045315.1 selenocysteine insertion sequence-binding protein 2-like [Megalobrama amblycephala]